MDLPEPASQCVKEDSAQTYCVGPEGLVRLAGTWPGQNLSEGEGTGGVF